GGPGSAGRSGARAPGAAPLRRAAPDAGDRGRGGRPPLDARSPIAGRCLLLHRAEWLDLDSARREIRVARALSDGGIGTPKSGHGRAVDMSQELASVLQRLRTERKTDAASGMG